MIIEAIVVLVLLGIGISVARRSRASRGDLLSGQEKSSSGAALDPERIFLYVLAFAGFTAFLYAITGLLALFLTTIFLRSSAVLSSSDARSHISYYLAALLIGTPLWLACWSRVQRQVKHAAGDRQSFERRMFMAAIFGTASVVALFSLHTFIRAILTLPGTSDTNLSLRDALQSAAGLLGWGGAWFGYARLGRQERISNHGDDPHDFAVYVLSGFALGFLVIGLWEAIRQIAGDMTGSGQSSLIFGSNGSVWIAWGSIAAWILAGGGTWAAIWRYDLVRGGRRAFRVSYLYLVLAVAVPAALGGGIDVLYETLRRVFGFHPGEGTWLYLRDALPLLLIGAGVWAYHWSVMRSQAQLANPRGGEGIPWPRRPGIVLLALLGLALAAPAFVSLLWLSLDSVFGTNSSLSGADWWRDRASFSVAAALIGSAAWLGAWNVLQRAATASAEERTARERRRFLGLVVMLGTATAAGFSIAVLWLIFQRVLGATQDTNTADWVLRNLSAVLVALAVVIYHGRIFRREQQPPGVAIEVPRVVALLAPGAHPALEELERLVGWHIEVGGYLSDSAETGVDALPALAQGLAALCGAGARGNALLILNSGGGTLYPYTTIGKEVSSAPDPGRSKAADVDLSFLDASSAKK